MLNAEQDHEIQQAIRSSLCPPGVSQQAGMETGNYRRVQTQGYSRHGSLVGRFGGLDRETVVLADLGDN